MKKIIFLFFFIPVTSFSQNGWNYLPDAPVASQRFDDVYFINDSTGWAVNGGGEIYKTSDYGNSWELQLLDFLHYFRTIEFINDSTGFAGTLDTSVYHTTDGGETWNLINAGFPNPVPGICGIGHFGNTIIMVGIWSEPAYILRSTDAGATWTYTNMASYASGLIDCWFKGPDTVFISGKGTDAINRAGVILRSCDGGVTWQQVGQSPNPSSYCWKLHFPSASTGYSSCEEYTTTSSHILKTIDGGATWFPLLVVNLNIDMEGIGFVNDSTGWVGGWSMGMYQTTNGGNSWSYVNFGRNFNRFFFLHPDLGYAAGLSIYKFDGFTTGIHPDAGSENKYIHDFDLSPNPAKDILKITLHINKNTHAIFEVYDTDGKLVVELAQGRFSKNNYNFELNLAIFKEGNYYAVLRTNEHFLTKKFTVLN